MTAINDLNVLTSTSNFPLSLPSKWDLKLRDNAIHKAFWGAFVGKERSGMPIIEKDDEFKGAGENLLITTVSRLRNAGVTGHSTLQGNEGSISEAQITVTIDWLRNAVATDKKTKKAIFWDFIQNANDQLSTWLANYTDYLMFNQLLVGDVAKTLVLYSNNKTAATALDESCTFGTAEIDKCKLAAIRRGCLPIKTITKGKQEYPIFGMVISEVDEFYLREDPVFRDALKYAQSRGMDNPIFDGSIGMYNGVAIYVHRTQDIELGVPLRPNCQIYGAHNNSVQTITVGADATVNYTQFFPSAGTLAVKGSGGAVEFITYTGKTANTFTGCTRGAAYGSLTTGGAAIYTGDEMVTLGNQMSKQIFFGSEIAVRGWGQRPKGTIQKTDFDFKMGIGIEALFGQKAIENTLAKTPNYLINCSYAGLSDPNI